MNLKLFFVLCLGIFAGCLMGLSEENYDFDKAWIEIDSLWQERLPKSMEAKVDLLYEAAFREDKTDQQVKALMYKLRVINSIEEVYAGKAINKAQEYLDVAKFPTKSVLHSIMAQLYWAYYLQNRSRFANRSEVINFDRDDISTWDLKTIIKESIKHFTMSLSEAKQLQKYPIGDFPAMLSKGSEGATLLRPTLYDFLIYQALSFYRNDESGISLPPEEFSLDDARYFESASSFADVSISTPDSLSFKYLALKLYQDLIRFHLSDEDPTALVEANLERLSFVYEKSRMAEKENLYEDALRFEMETYADFPVSSHAAYKLGFLYVNRSRLYDPQISSEHRWHLKTAVDICSNASQRYPKSFGGHLCRELIQDITKPVMELHSEQTVITNTVIKAKLSLKTITGVMIKLYRIPYPSIDIVDVGLTHDWLENDKQKLKDIYKREALWSSVINVSYEGDYRLHSYEIPLTELTSGYYLLLAANIEGQGYKEAEILGYSFFSCRDLAYIRYARNDGNMMILNQKTGKVIHGAEVSAYKWERNKDTRIARYFLNWRGISDDKGMIKIPKDAGYRLQITHGLDSLFIYENDIQTPYISTSKFKQCLIYTDRAIYRPGQSVHVKGVFYETDYKRHYKLLPGKSIQVYLMDVHGNSIVYHTLKTNDYGTFSCSFTIPKGILTGTMRIHTNSGSTQISVEEYKRPHFEVLLNPPTDTIKLNKEISIRGSALALAGFPIDNGIVKYRIFRQAQYPRWYWWWGTKPESPQKEIASGTVVCDSLGEFTLKFIASGDQSVLQSHNPFFHFIVQVDVTDISGETRSASLNIKIGEKELVFDLELAESIDLQQSELIIPVFVNNQMNEPIAVKGELRISRLQAPDHAQKRRLWSAPDRNYLKRSEYLKLFPYDVYADEDNIETWAKQEEVFFSAFETPQNDKVKIDHFNTWRQGIYVLEAQCTHKQQTAQIKKYFTVFDSESPFLPYSMVDWFVPLKVHCEPGEEAKLLIGSAYSDVLVLYEVEKDSKIVQSKYLRLNNSQQLLKVPVSEADRGGFHIHLSFMRDGRFYSHVQEITVPWTNKQISFEYISFRDKLLPGQQEQWRVKLKDYMGADISAEVLASMYDASLDALKPGDWGIDIFGKVARHFTWINVDSPKINALYWIYKIDKRYARPYRQYDELNLFGYPLGYNGWQPPYSLHYLSGRGRSINTMALTNSSAKHDLKAFNFEPYEASDNMMSLPAKAVSNEQSIVPLRSNEDLSGVQSRSNFAETAFFYPALQSDEMSEIGFEFTVPEALTRWKFRALALSKDFKIGTTQRYSLTQKPLMVSVNAPRFFREGDKIAFTCRITSLDEEDKSGFCKLYLYDAISMEAIDAHFKLGNAQQAFHVKKGESLALDWILDIPFGINAVTYKVVAQAGDFSDGEQSTLPILSNRMLVTESLPLSIEANSSKSFVFKKLSKMHSSHTLKNHKLTLEFSSNPAWYALQALPYMMEYPYQCTEQVFSRFYANSLASHLVNSNPRIKRVFESWRDTPGSTALISNLEKNQELKAVLLQETPWVLDAKNESLAKQRIALLFDLNKMTEQFNSSLLHLRKTQSQSGAWPWFQGMEDSRWITQHIVAGFGHLDILGVAAIRNDKHVWNMLQWAISYLDAQIIRDYENAQKHANPDLDHLHYVALHYLYTRSFFKDIAIPSAATEAVQYFKTQSGKYWVNKGIYGQALIALYLHRYGNDVIPAKIIASLKERARYDTDLGMWWNYENGWNWHQAPIETQALLIELFSEVAKDVKSVDAMRTWLLKNKQTNNWNTTKATTEATFALLSTGSNWLDTQSLAEIVIGGQELDPIALDDSSVEAGTGYFKTSWTGSDIQAKMANIRINNANPVSAWGALYWQYFENLDKISVANTPLKLDKKLFIERMSPTGKVLDPVTSDTEIKIGDKVIVRIVLRCDRDMQYLHLKDMRGAGMEPINVLSNTKWQDGLSYYEATGDVATNFFIEYLHRGTYVFEYPLRAANIGDFSNGITTIQCMYAPEFSSHSEGIRIKISK